MTAFRWCDHRLFLQLSKYYPQFSPRFVALFFEGKYRMCFVLPWKCSRTHLITSYLRKASPCKTPLQNSYHLFVDIHRIFVSCVSITGSTGHWLCNSMLWYLYRWCCHGIHHVFTVKNKWDVVNTQTEKTSVITHSLVACKRGLVISTERANSLNNINYVFLLHFSHTASE